MQSYIAPKWIMCKVDCRAAFAVILATLVTFLYYSATNLSESFLVGNSNSHGNMFELIKQHEQSANCDEILAGNHSAIQSAAAVNLSTAVAQTTADCQHNLLVFPAYPMTELEREYPLAYSISIYKNLNQFMRMFRLIVLQKFGAQREKQELYF